MFQNDQLLAFFQKNKIKGEEKERTGPNITQDFKYVVERKDQDRICFLSGQDRYSKKPLTSITANATVISPEKCSAINALLTKIRSNRGVGGLSDLSDRFQKIRLDDTPGPTKYDPDYKKKVKPSRYPFGRSTSKCKLLINKNPGPGTYEESWQCRRPLKKHTFGGKMLLSPCVETVCSPYIVNKCEICEKLCEGDYWHIEYTTFLCLKCMYSEKHSPTTFKMKELRRFKKIRNCAYMHQHEGTTAAIRILPKFATCTKFRKENYLENFFNKYC